MQTQHPQNTSRAIALMISAIFLFSAMDATAKAVSAQVGVLTALWARYAGQMIVVMILVAPRLRQVVKTHYPWLQLARSLLLLTASGLLFFGVSLIGLAEATAIIVLNPLFISIGGVVFLGERLGLRRIIAICVAFIGAMLIIRPGSASFEPAALLPLGAALSFAGYVLITRAVGAKEDVWTSLFYTALVGGVIMSATAPTYWVWPDVWGAALMLAIALFGTVGQLLLIRAATLAPASTLAPFAYSGLLFAICFGLVIFGDIPDLYTLLGGAIIVSAGLYVWYRETR